MVRLGEFSLEFLNIRKEEQAARTQVQSTAAPYRERGTGFAVIQWSWAGTELKFGSFVPCRHFVFLQLWANSLFFFALVVGIGVTARLG